MFVIYSLLWSFALGSIFFNERFESGFLVLKDSQKIFYWLTKSRANIPKPPLVLWLQGGPGCSCINNVLTENGPFHLDFDGNFSLSPFSWNNVADVLYVDQPLGTGFSACSDLNRIPKTSLEAAKDIYDALEDFMRKHPEYQGGQFYITGHSFAGHFIPVLVKQLYDNKFSLVNLVGIAIGNGWFKPALQIQSFAPFEREKGLHIHSYDYSVITIAAQLNAFFTGLGLNKIGDFFFRAGLFLSMGVNPRYSLYNIKQNCSAPNGCNNDTFLHNFIARKDVREELKVGDLPWEVCSAQVKRHFVNDFYTDVSDVLREVIDLHPTLKVTLYHGNEDWISNEKGMEMFLDEFQWTGNAEFKKQDWTAWYVSGRNAGRYKKAKNVKFYDVNDAGHMVALDQPEFAYDIFIDLITS